MSGIDWQGRCADQAALIQSIDADRDRLIAEVERLRDLVREVGCSGVELEDPRMDYLLVQINRATWDQVADVSRIPATGEGGGA